MSSLLHRRSDLERFVRNSQALESGERTAIKASASAGIRTNISTDTLILGDYYFYAVDAAGNISLEVASLVIQPPRPDTTAPILTLISGTGDDEIFIDEGETAYYSGQMITACSDENGMLYVVDSSELENLLGASEPTEEDLEELVNDSHGFTFGLHANVETNINGLAIGTFYSVFAADAAGNLSREIHIAPVE